MSRGVLLKRNDNKRLSKALQGFVLFYCPLLRHWLPLESHPEIYLTHHQQSCSNVGEIKAGLDVFAAGRWGGADHCMQSVGFSSPPFVL